MYIQQFFFFRSVLPDTHTGKQLMRTDKLAKNLTSAGGLLVSILRLKPSLRETPNMLIL
jgi:hypothetical protein